MRQTLLIIIASFMCMLASAQDDGNYEYNKEFIWGVQKNTNGGLIGGFIFKKSKAINDRTFRTYGLELMNVKHPKEDKRVSPQSGNTYIFGKRYYLYSVRLQTGFERILFKKAPQQGVQILYGASIGPTIGLEAPYYVEVVNGAGDGIERVHYDPTKADADHSSGKIVGTGRLFQGLFRSNIVPGLNAKASMSFEFGTFKSNVTGFEVGLNFEAFPREICLIPVEHNQSIFTSAFITLFYGNRR
ncbi:MAG: hypothetical protein RJQ09_08345 [Cyclobacteriaceae bacterium]